MTAGEGYSEGGDADNNNGAWGRDATPIEDFLAWHWEHNLQRGAPGPALRALRAAAAAPPPAPPPPDEPPPDLEIEPSQFDLGV